MSLGRTSLAVSLVTFFEKICAFVLVLMASRLMGDESVGEFFYYFSLACMVIPLVDMGFGKLFLQAWWKDDRPQEKLFARLMVLKVFLGVAALGLLVAIDQVVRWGEGHPLAVSAAFLAVFLERFSDFFLSPARANHDFRGDLVVPVVARILNLVLLFVCVNGFTSGYQLAWLYVIANGAGALLSLYAFRYCRPDFRGSWTLREGGRLLKEGLPFSLTALFVMISFYVDSVMLGHFSFAEVGHYNAAYRIILVMVVLSGGVCRTLFPRILQLRGEGRQEEAGWFINGSLQVFVLVFGALMVGSIYTGPSLLPMLFGSSFVSSGQVFVVLAPLILLASLTNLLGHTLEAMELQKQVVRINACSACFNVAANLVLIPRWGMYGAAVTTLLTETLTLLQIGLLLRKHRIWPDLYRGIPRALLFVIVAGLVLFPFRVLTAPVALVVNGGILFLLLLAYSPWWPEVVRSTLRKLVSGRRAA